MLRLCPGLYLLWCLSLLKPLLSSAASASHFGRAPVQSADLEKLFPSFLSHSIGRPILVEHDRPLCLCTLDLCSLLAWSLRNLLLLTCSWAHSLLAWFLFQACCLLHLFFFLGPLEQLSWHAFPCFSSSWYHAFGLPLGLGP